MENISVYETLRKTTMGQVRNQTHSALRKFVYEELEGDQLKRKLRHIEQDTTGANPHNIGMATLEYVNTSVINGETEREIKQILADTFLDHKLPGRFPEDWDGE